MQNSSLRIVFSFFVVLISCLGLYASTKPLSEKDRTKLADIARHQYDLTMMDGATIYKFKGRDILLVITEVKKSPNAQRVGQIKASRLAGEFLQSATNKSISVYEVSEGGSYSFQNEGSELNSTSGSISGGTLSQSTGDFTATETKAFFSDKIIQSSITQIGHIEPLCRIGAEGNNILFAYFMILQK